MGIPFNNLPSLFDQLDFRPRVHEFIHEMNTRVLSQFPDAITVGEMPFTRDAAEIVKYVQPERKELNMAFLFEQNDLDGYPSAPLIPAKYKLSDLKKIIKKWQEYMYENGGWNTLYQENHDVARSITRMLGIKDPRDSLRARGAKLLCILQLTQGGTLFVYEGQEFGMINVPIDWDIEEYKDVATQNYYKEVLERRIEETGNPKPDMSDIKAGINLKARDNGRTPVQWSSAPHGGFTSPNAIPWMRVNDDYPYWNAEVQLNDPDSVLSFWKKTINFRKANKVLTYGDFKLLSPEDEKVFAYTRNLNNLTALVIMNFSKEKTTYSDRIVGVTGTAKFLHGNVVSDAIPSLSLEQFEVSLEAWEGRVYIKDV
ncbi:glycoside hydrolase family 13 protein [Sphaerobolus stellatus SS14]|uniref:Glycoside hydrolase family 13 protein n=1 Tax=Sphaerobolus stellatus (strain SS14) TaxID=990650 RepID=A0A0C9U6C5_SPHS4|nr:glycoside hydrolase family 13 protein [Sphaerobolus stellatus SS14]